MEFERGCILIADDDTDARAIVKLGIADLGYEVVEAKDGVEALEVFQKRVPVLAIIDMTMPRMSGKEVCKHIKERSNLGIIPVLMLTACDTLQEKVAAFADGVDEYLTKPFHLEELQARVKALLRIRELNVRLLEKNAELVSMQERLVQQERQAVVGQLAGTAAHQLGQPLSAILLNCHLLERLPASDDRFQKAVVAIKDDARRMSDLIEKLKTADATRTARYHREDAILEIESAVAATGTKE